MCVRGGGVGGKFQMLNTPTAEHSAFVGEAAPQSRQRSGRVAGIWSEEVMGRPWSQAQHASEIAPKPGRILPPGPASRRMVSPGRLAASAAAREPNCDRYQWQPAPSSGSSSQAEAPAGMRAAGRPGLAPGGPAWWERRRRGASAQPACAAACVTYSQERRSRARSRKRCRAAQVEGICWHSQTSLWARVTSPPPLLPPLVSRAARLGSPWAAISRLHTHPAARCSIEQVGKGVQVREDVEQHVVVQGIELRQTHGACVRFCGAESRRRLRRNPDWRGLRQGATGQVLHTVRSVQKLMQQMRRTQERQLDV